MTRACATSEIYRDARLLDTGRARCRRTWSIHAHDADQRDALTAGHRGGGAVARAAPAPQRGERAIYLHEIQDPGNLGTILRTLAWFGKFRCLLSPDSVDVHNGKVVRASMGAIFHVPVEIDVPLDALAERVSAHRHARSAGPADRDAANFAISTAMCSAMKRAGLPREQLAALQARSHSRLRAPASIESLNVAATVNICQYELNRAIAGVRTTGSSCFRTGRARHSSSRRSFRSCCTGSRTAHGALDPDPRALRACRDRRMRN